MSELTAPVTVSPGTFVEIQGGEVWGNTTGDRFINVQGGGTVTVSNCYIHDNSMPVDGGKGFRTEGHGPKFPLYAFATVSGCTFTANTAGTGEESPNFGGAVDIVGGSVSIIDCVFENNKVWGVGPSGQSAEEWGNCPIASFGGAVSNRAYNSFVSLKGCVFRGNSAESNNENMYALGGAVANGQTTVIEDCVFVTQSDTIANVMEPHTIQECSITFKGNNFIGADIINKWENYLTPTSGAQIKLADNAVLTFINADSITHVDATLNASNTLVFQGNGIVDLYSCYTEQLAQISIVGGKDTLIGNSQTFATNCGFNTDKVVTYWGKTGTIESYNGSLKLEDGTLSGTVRFADKARSTNVEEIEDFGVLRFIGSNYTEDFGTVTLGDNKIVIGDGIELTKLTGTLFTSDRELKMQSLDLTESIIYGGAGELSFTNVSMAKASRIFGGGTNTSQTEAISLSIKNCAIAGQIYAGGENMTSVGDINLNIDGNSTAFSNVFAGASVLTDEEFEAGAITTTIKGGTFGKVTGNGSWMNGGASTQGDSYLSIADGTFKTFVYAGAYCDGNDATVTGDITVNISGGTFNGYVLGGCLGKTTADANRATVTGNIGVTISGGTFSKDLVVGNKGQGTIVGNTSLTFTGTTGATFGADTSISGVNAKYYATNKSTWFGLEGNGTHTSTLIFDGYTKEIGASINESFTNVEVRNNSKVALNGNKTSLSLVSNWQLEVGTSNLSGNALLDFNGALGACDFTGDTINLTFDEGVSLTSGNTVTLMSFDKFASTGLLNASLVTLGGESTTKTDAGWDSTSYTLSYGTDNKTLVLAAK